MTSKEELFYEFFYELNSEKAEAISIAWKRGWDSCKCHHEEILKKVMEANNSPVLRDALIKVLKQI